MTKRDWLTVALKTLGMILVFFYLWVWALFFAMPFALADEFRRHDSSVTNVLLLVFALAAAVSGLVVGILLVIYGDRLADRLAPQEAGDDDDPDSQRALFFVALKFVGVVCVVWGFQRLLGNIGSGFVFADFIPSSSTLGGWLHLIAWPMVLLAIGIWLTCDGKLLMRMAFGNASTSSEDIDPLSWQPRVIFSVALRILGVVLLVVRLPWLVSVLIIRAFPITIEMEGGAKFEWPSVKWPGFIGGLLVLAASVYLIRGAEHLVRLVFRDEAPATLSGQQGESP